MTARAWILRDGAAKNCTLDECAASLDGADMVWVHLDGGAPETVRWLGGRGLSPLVVSALTQTETRPRADVFDGGALLNMRGLDAESVTSPDLLASIRLWVSEGKVYSVAMRDLLALTKGDEAFEVGAIRDAGDLVCVLATAITKELDPDVAMLGDALDDCEGSLDNANAFTMRRSIARVRGKAIAYRRFLGPQRTALSDLAGMHAPWLGEDDRRHLGEAADRAARMAEELEAIRERAALMHEQLTDLRAEQIDVRSLILSIAAMVFLPLTFITGLFGMNVQGIPFAEDPAGFWIIAIGCIVVSVAITAYFIWRRWSR